MMTIPEKYECPMCKETEKKRIAALPWNNARKLLAAWTAENYQGPYPNFVNVTQVNSAAEITLRGPNVAGEMVTTTIVVNAWTLAKMGEVLIEASRAYEGGLQERIFEEHQKATPTAPKGEA